VDVFNGGEENRTAQAEDAGADIFEAHSAALRFQAPAFSRRST
jgi:hypothetical protein